MQLCKWSLNWELPGSRSSACRHFYLHSLLIYTNIKMALSWLDERLFKKNLKQINRVIEIQLMLVGAKKAMPQLKSARSVAQNEMPSQTRSQANALHSKLTGAGTTIEAEESKLPGVIRLWSGWISKLPLYLEQITALSPSHNHSPAEMAAFQVLQCKFRSKMKKHNITNELGRAAASSDRGKAIRKNTERKPISWWRSILLSQSKRVNRWGTFLIRLSPASQFLQEDCKSSNKCVGSQVCISPVRWG